MGALVALIALGDAGAQSNSRSLAQVERDRRAETARAERLRAEAAQARAEVSALDARLVESGRRRAEAEAAAADAEARLATLHALMDDARSRRARARSGFEAALIAAAFAERRIEPRAMRIGLLARAAAPGFVQEERRSRRALDDGADLEARIAEEQVALAEAQAAIEAERTELTALIAQRRAAQTRLASDADAAARRARTLAAEARNLRELAQRLERANRRATAGGDASVIPAGWQAPAEGVITRPYGAREGQGPAAQGAVLRTRAGAQVLSPEAGEVAYAGPFRSYGQVLILNLDGGYVLVLTGLDTVRARVGETVRAGQPIGEMAAAGAAAPELYVEVRRGGRPVDPTRWLAARGLTADRGARAG